MTSRTLKDSIYGEFAVLSKALAAPKRLELLELLAQCPRSVEALADQTAITIANASQHLKVLRAARLVDAEKRGLNVVYRLAGEDVAHAVLTLRILAESRNHAMRETRSHFLKKRNQLESVTSEQLLQRIREGAVTLIDVRPPEEYAAGHLKGALNIPLTDFRKRLPLLKKRTEIVAYCRGPYCVMALDAVQTLRNNGYRAQALDLGVVEMRSLGLSIATA
jgi:rhodanese-related sulfurtransferase/DNA-binding transcriptional ArsR family regulator